LRLNRKEWRKWCIFVSLFLFKNCFGLPVIAFGTTCPNQVFYVWMVDLQAFCAKYGLKTWSSPDDDIRKCLLHMQRIWTKTRFETWITRNDMNGVNLFLLSYLITLMAYLCSQWAPKFQIKYFMLVWSIYRIFVLNKVWKRDSLQMMIFEYICSTCSVDGLKTRFDSWIAWNEVNGVYTFHNF
jgi:hypothetical protein